MLTSLEQFQNGRTETIYRKRASVTYFVHGKHKKQ